MSSTAVPLQRPRTVEILQHPSLTSLLTGEYPANELLSAVSSNIKPSLLNLPCRDQHKCQPSTEPAHSRTKYFISLNWPATQAAWSPRYIASGGSNRKHRLQQFLNCCYRWLLSENSETVDMYTGCCQATHVLSRDHCIPTVYYILQYGPITKYCGQGNEFPESVKAEISWKAEWLSNFQKRHHTMELVCRETLYRIFHFVWYQFNNFINVKWNYGARKLCRRKPEEAWFGLNTHYQRYKNIRVAQWQYQVEVQWNLSTKDK
jgi:hypothetical protein